MYLPEWTLPFKEPRTEIRLINGTYYKCQVGYKYNSIKKRTDKQTIQLLGKISQENGFVPSDKDIIRQKANAIPKVDIKTFGVYNLFSDLIAKEIASFKTCFGDSVGETVLSFAMMRWAYNSPIKRASHYHIHDFCSELWMKNAISDKHISNSLKVVGENREKLVDWMKSMLQIDKTHCNKFVMMDSTHVTSLSEQLAVNAKGYNPNHNYDPQVRLMYLFSAHLKQPVYFRLINGNITDAKSMSICIKEMNIKDVIYIADKGFLASKT